MESNPAQAPVVESQPVTPPVSEPKKGFPKFALILAAFIILFLVGGGAYLLGKSSTPKQEQPTTAEKQTPAVTNTPTTTPTPDETASWETYTGNAYSIKYPTDYHTSITASGLSISDSTGQFNLIISSEPTSLDLNSYINSKSSCTSITSSNGQAYKIDVDNFLRYEKNPCGQAGSTDLYGIHGGIAYHLSIPTQENYDSTLVTLNQILSSFKFTK